PGHAAAERLTAPLVLSEQLFGAASELTSSHRLDTPAPAGGHVTRGITKAHVSLRVHVLAQADPDGCLWTDHRIALRVSVQANEVHAQLGQLPNDGFVIIRAPPIRPFAEVVERLDAPQTEERPVGL